MKQRSVVAQKLRRTAEHQDELHEDQKAIFAPLITEYNEKKSLNITHPEETLAQLQAVL